MKIALVFPPYSAEDLLGASKSLKNVLNIMPPLGIAYLAAVLGRHDYEVKLYDCSLDISHVQLLELLREEQPDIIGISSTTPSFESAKRVARGVREYLPGATTIIGGSHVTAIPEQAMAGGYFDIGVIGEGEETLLELVQHIETHGLRNLSQVSGIVFMDESDGHLVSTGRRPFIQDLDTLPFPARHLLPPLANYQPTPASYKKLPLAGMITSRGCPSSCTFCDRAVFGQRYRFRSAANILDEVEELISKYGAKEIRFFDDTFTVSKQRTAEICHEFQRRGLNIPWSCLTRVSTVTKELLQMMKEAGCWQVSYGLESGDPRMLSLLKKGSTVESNEKAVCWAREAGLGVRADFIVGTPGETMESLERTIAFAISMDLDYVQFNKFVPLPGTQLYRELIEQGYQFDFSGYSTGISDNADPMYIPDDIAPKEYKTILDRAYHRFYLRPAYMMRRLRAIHSLEELKGHVDGLLGILRL